MASGRVGPGPTTTKRLLFLLLYVPPSSLSLSHPPDFGIWNSLFSHFHPTPPAPTRPPPKRKKEIRNFFMRSPPLFESDSYSYPSGKKSVVHYNSRYIYYTLLVFPSISPIIFLDISGRKWRKNRVRPPPPPSSLSSSFFAFIFSL